MLHYQERLPAFSDEMRKDNSHGGDPEAYEQTHVCPAIGVMLPDCNPIVFVSEHR